MFNVCDSPRKSSDTNSLVLDQQCLNVLGEEPLCPICPIKTKERILGMKSPLVSFIEAPINFKILDEIMEPYHFVPILVILGDHFVSPGSSFRGGYPYNIRPRKFHLFSKTCRLGGLGLDKLIDVSRDLVG